MGEKRTSQGGRERRTERMKSKKEDHTRRLPQFLLFSLGPTFCQTVSADIPWKSIPQFWYASAQSPLSQHTGLKHDRQAERNEAVTKLRCKKMKKVWGGERSNAQIHEFGIQLEKVLSRLWVLQLRVVTDLARVSVLHCVGEFFLENVISARSLP